jgi:opacity protein-like surface antigen
MFRKSMIAFAAIAALSTTALVSADAFAKPNGGGWGKGGGMGWHHSHYGARYGFYGFDSYAPDCYQVVTRRGYLRTVCAY